MATNRTMQTGDTWPPLKGLASDSNGPVDLASAASMRVLLKSTTLLIELIPSVLDPIEVDAGESFNWAAEWTAGDSDAPGTYLVQLEVTWTTGRVEMFPNSHAAAPTVTIETANA